MRNLQDFILSRLKYGNNAFERQRLRHTTAGVVQKLMAKNRVSINDLANKSGVSLFSLRRFLAKKSLPPLDDLSNISSALGYQVNVIFRNRSTIDDGDYIESLDPESFIVEQRDHKYIRNAFVLINVTVYDRPETVAFSTTAPALNNKRESVLHQVITGPEAGFCQQTECVA